MCAHHAIRNVQHTISCMSSMPLCMHTCICSIRLSWVLCMCNTHVYPVSIPTTPMCSDQHLCQVYKNVMWIFPSCACYRRHSHCCRHVRNVVHVKFDMHRSPFLPLVGPLGVCGNTDSPYRWVGQDPPAYWVTAFQVSFYATHCRWPCTTLQTFQRSLIWKAWVIIFMWVVQTLCHMTQVLLKLFLVHGH